MRNRIVFVSLIFLEEKTQHKGNVWIFRNSCTVLWLHFFLNIINFWQATPFMTTKQITTYTANYGLQAY